MTPPGRILIVLLGAIGDVVCGLPLARRLRVGWPDAHIAWAVEPTAAPLLEGHPAVDETIVFQRGGGAAALRAVLRALRANRAELSLDLQRHFKSGFFAWASGARVRLGFHWRNAREGNWFFTTDTIAPVDAFTAKLLHFQRFADHLGVPPAPIDFALAASAAERERAAALLAEAGSRVAVLYVGSSWESRRWLPAATAELSRALQRRGFGVALVGGKADAAFAEAVVAAAAGEVVNCVGRTSLREVIAIMERASVAIGPDSGPMHIADAVGTPLVALFGATSPRRSGPWRGEVIRGDAPCAPCYRTRCPIGQVCMESITPAMVLARIERVLADAAVPAAEVCG